MNKKYIILFLLLFTLRGFGQITFQFVPEIYGRNVDGLFNCRITNPFQKVVASMKVTVSERKAGTICIIKTPDFNVYPGTNIIPGTAAKGSIIQYANNRLAQITSLSRAFPEGDYEYCYSLSFTHSDNPPDEQCFNYTLAPFADLNLVEPYNKDTICSKRPLLSWQPLIPGVPGAYYQLVLAEIKPGQSATEALNYNLAIINQSSIMSPVLPYPSVAKELDKKKNYAWQVTAYKNQTVLNRSEIWEFNVNCHDTTTKIVIHDGYRDIDDLLKGNYYLAKGYIRFALTNPYQQTKLKYEVHSLLKPGKKIKGLPQQPLINGINNVTIDLSANGDFEDNHYYIMQLWLPNGNSKSLRFLYLEPQQ